MSYCQWRRKQFESGGAQFPARSAGKIFFTVPHHFFMVPPPHDRALQGSAGHSNKNLARAEMAECTRPKRSLTFQGHAVSKVTSPTDRARVVSRRSSVDTTPYHAPFPRYCVSIFKQIFGQFRGT